MNLCFHACILYSLFLFCDFSTFKCVGGDFTFLATGKGGQLFFYFYHRCEKFLAKTDSQAKRFTEHTTALQHILELIVLMSNCVTFLSNTQLAFTVHTSTEIVYLRLQLSETFVINSYICCFSVCDINMFTKFCICIIRIRTFKHVPLLIFLVVLMNPLQCHHRLLQVLLGNTEQVFWKVELF